MEDIIETGGDLEKNEPLVSMRHGFMIYTESPVSFLLKQGVPEKSILNELSKASCIKVKESHAQALLTLTKSASPEERDTWPLKTGYAEKHSAAVSSANSQNETLAEADKIVITDGFGLTEEQQGKISLALLPGETINDYLSDTLANIDAYETLAFFAEGFKRKTKKAIEAAEDIEQISAVMTQAAADMEAAMVQFQQQLGQD